MKWLHTTQRSKIDLKRHYYTFFKAKIIPKLKAYLVCFYWKTKLCQMSCTTVPKMMLQIHSLVVLHLQTEHFNLTPTSKN